MLSSSLFLDTDVAAKVNETMERLRVASDPNEKCDIILKLVDHSKGALPIQLSALPQWRSLLQRWVRHSQ